MRIGDQVTIRYSSGQTHSARVMAVTATHISWDDAGNRVVDATAVMLDVDGHGVYRFERRGNDDWQPVGLWRWEGSAVIEPAVAP